LKVIKEVEIVQYKKQILTSYNETRTTWNIVKSKTRKKRGKEKISLLNLNGKLIQNQQTVANSVNDYFLKTAEKLTGANQIDKMRQLKKECLYIIYFKIVGAPIPILNSGTHQLKR